MVKLHACQGRDHVPIEASTCFGTHFIQQNQETPLLEGELTVLSLLLMLIPLIFAAWLRSKEQEESLHKQDIIKDFSEYVIKEKF